jgi:hypothetical protein
MCPASFPTAETRKCIGSTCGAVRNNTYLSADIGTSVTTQMKKPDQVTHVEPRWPVTLTSLAVLALLTVLPGRMRPGPSWFAPVVIVALNAPMVALRLTNAKARWLRIEAIVTALFVVIVCLFMIADLKILFSAMLSPSAEVTGLQLLTSSVAVWVTNVLVFSVAYWRVDRGGPESRANHAGSSPDWLFPQESGDAPFHRNTTYVDYLFLAFWTATAFSPTDAPPLTFRAKLLMVLESIISFVTILAVASRAINILGK